MPPKAPKKAPKNRPVMGAPSKGDDARNISLHVKVSANELRLWTKLAKKAGKTLGAFVLEPLRAKHPTEYELTRTASKKEQ
jgi:hypothetical protein